MMRLRRRPHPRQAPARASQQRVMKPLWKFAQHGESGSWVSDLFPEIARHVDDLCFLHGMHTEGVAHGPATLFLHCGATNLIRPSMGSWVIYGLGTENENLPGFVTDRPVGGQRRAAQLRQRLPAGRLPGHGHRPGRRARDRGDDPQPGQRTARRAEQRRQFDLLQRCNAEQLTRTPGDAELEAVIDSYELAWRMQTHAPGRARPGEGDAGDAGALRHRREGDRQLRPAVPDGPAAVRGGRALRAGQLRRQHRQPGLGPALEPAQARRPRPGGRQADRRPARRPEAARPAGRHARLVGRRVRPHAVRREERHRPRPQPRRLHRLAGRRRRQAAASPTARPTSSATRPSRTRSTCTTCTPRSCTCSASTTRS